MAARLTKARRLSIIIAISFSFFAIEIAAGFYTRSLALVADAFHYLNDLIGFIVALVAFKISERSDSPKELSFGWQRASLLGAFFNGVFLLALGISILLQSIERFFFLQLVENPELVFTTGCVGLALNIISAIFLHEHDEDVHRVNPDRTDSREDDSHATGLGSSYRRAHLTSRFPEMLQRMQVHSLHRHKPTLDAEIGGKEHDHNMMGVLLHVMGDAANNIGVIIASLVIWKATYPGRFYADPAVSMVIAIMIFLSAWPLIKKTGMILLGSVPIDVNLRDVQHDIERVPGVASVHELHMWRLNQRKAVASAHIIVSDQRLSSFMDIAQIINECFHAYGIHSVTLQPELAMDGNDHSGSPSTLNETDNNKVVKGVMRKGRVGPVCMVGCGTTICEELTCCG